MLRYPPSLFSNKMLIKNVMRQIKRPRCNATFILIEGREISSLRGGKKLSSWRGEFVSAMGGFHLRGE